MQITPVFVMKVMLTLLLFEMISLSMRLAKNLLDHQPIKKNAAVALKNAVERVLRTHFPYQVHRGNKSIKVDGNTYRKNADTVPSVAVHYYYRSHLKDYSTFWDGIVIYADDGQIIRNFPKQHIANGKAKNNQTKYYYKRMVRIIKKMRDLMSDLGYACANNVSSFGLESLLWNLPDSCFTKWTNYGFAFEKLWIIYIRTSICSLFIRKQTESNNSVQLKEMSIRMLHSLTSLNLFSSMITHHEGLL